MCKLKLCSNSQIARCCGSLVMTDVTDIVFFENDAR